MKATHEAICVKIKLLPHKDSDFLSIVKIDDFYNCVVRTTDWTGIDKAVYVLPDSLVDVTRPEFNFLAADAKFDENSNPVANGTYARIKAKKLRGVQSYGVLIPYPDAVIGEDYYDKLGIKRYEPPIKGVPGESRGYSFGGEVSAPPKLGFDASKYDVDSHTHIKKCFVEGEPVWVSLKYHGCFHEQSKVMLVNGEEREIKDIKENDLILSYNENTKDFESDLVNKVLVNNFKKEWILLTFDNHKQIKCTSDHKFLTHNRGWVEAKDLTENDALVSIF